MNDRINFVGPDWTGLGWSAAPLAVAVAILILRNLGQARAVVIASGRLVAQMGLLALALGAIVAADSPWLVLFVASIMLATAAHAVGSRSSASGDRWRLRFESFAALCLGASIVMVVSTRLALQVEPWYAPRTVLPMLGMILGNAVSAVSLAAERFDSEIRRDREGVELRLTLGASARQAAMPATRSAVAAGLTPILNNMSLAGIVAIPGMTTGQLLAGADVGQAVRYQILLYLGIAATTAFSVLILLEARFRRAFTREDQLRG